ncbi:MAG TPA: DUF488 domain-containing protein, partial [Candidatus Saccharimonadales bacterium]|nr:DUF488 domain-containing protein [Candidatus Saccharimonadales bacterium]
GHSTRDIDEFIGMLDGFKVQRLVDIRTLPGSKRYPQFNQENLSVSLKNAGIDYVYLKDLGGLRKKSADSINLGWRNLSFRNYADYMQTDEFRAALKELVQLADNKTTSIMCAEAVPWRCHRSLVTDALLVRDIEVRHIMASGKANPATLTSFAKVSGVDITYPGEN